MGAVSRPRLGWRSGITIGLITVMAALLFVPERRLSCDDPWLSERSPDGVWTLTVCRRPMLFAMPGGSSDAPGWIVLRDSGGAIHGVVHLDMMQLLSEAGAADGTRWETAQVVLPTLASIPLAPASGPVFRWLDDRVWRLRALVGAVPSDSLSAQW